MEFGPVQVVVVGFSDDDFAGKILPELRRLRSGSVVRLLDALFVTKDESGCLTTLDVGDEVDEEWAGFGETVSGLIGFGAEGEDDLSVGADAGTADGAASSDAGDAWAISDAIPAGTCAAVVLMEHPWAIRFRTAVMLSGGFALEDTWLHPADLRAVGALPGDAVAGTH